MGLNHLIAHRSMHSGLQHTCWTTTQSALQQEAPGAGNRGLSKTNVECCSLSPERVFPGAQGSGARAIVAVIEVVPHPAVVAILF